MHFLAVKAGSVVASQFAEAVYVEEPDCLISTVYAVTAAPLSYAGASQVISTPSSLVASVTATFCGASGTL